MIWVCAAIIGLLIGIIIYLYPKHKVDEEIVQKNNRLKIENSSLQDEIAKLNAEVASAETETAALERHKSSLYADIDTISKQATAATEEIYKKSYDLMQEKMSQSAEIAMYHYQKAEKEHKDEYLKTLEESTKYFTDTINEKKLELENITNELAILKEKADSAIAADKRRMLDEQSKDYYKIKVSEEDIEDISMLKDVAKKLNKDPEPINKIIWELYYKRPTMDLLGRLTPTGQTHCGIYKITNINSGQCYIGQSVDLRNRLRDHIKAGLGIASSNNRFYTEMKTSGPEAFMYEILEECEREALNERERYWIDFYSSTDWGYNTLQGNRN